MLGKAGSMLGLGGDKPAVDVDSQIGEEANKQVIAGDQDRQEFEVEADEGDVQVNNESKKANTQQDFKDKVENVVVTNISTTFLVLLIAGWVLPTPQGIFRYVVRKITRRKRNG